MTATGPVPRARPAVRGLAATGTLCTALGMLLALEPAALPAPVAPVVAAPEAAPAPAGVVPVALVIRDAAAPVVPVGTGPDGALALPDAPSTVGWWAPGALAGAAAGTTVLAGHVDSAAAGLGAFAVLRELAVGERVELRGADGRAAAYRVTARHRVAKAALPADLFATGGPPRLVLITCGGRFDPVARHYADNVVVAATPA